MNIVLEKKSIGNTFLITFICEINLTENRFLFDGFEKLLKKETNYIPIFNINLF